jgi:hypothetical protein
VDRVIAYKKEQLLKRKWSPYLVSGYSFCS